MITLLRNIRSGHIASDKCHGKFYSRQNQERGAGGDWIPTPSHHVLWDNTYWFPVNTARDLARAKFETFFNALPLPMRERNNTTCSRRQNFHLGIYSLIPKNNWIACPLDWVRICRKFLALSSLYTKIKEIFCTLKVSRCFKMKDRRIEMNNRRYGRFVLSNNVYTVLIQLNMVGK